MAHRNLVSGFTTAIFYSMIVNNFGSGVSSVAATVSVVTMSVRPTPQSEGTSDALITFKTTDPESFTPHTRSLERFLNAYKMPGYVPGRDSTIYVCDYDHPPRRPGMVCYTDVGQWSPCISADNFGYHRGTPCIFLKIDTPPGWTPEFYNDTGSLPLEMPADLKSYIKNSNFSQAELNTVWVSCEGVYPADKEFIGSIKFIPRQGYPGYYFLNNQAEGYLSPLVTLHLERPLLGVIINIKCQAWARNIDHNADSGLEGGIQFALMID